MAVKVREIEKETEVETTTVAPRELTFYLPWDCPDSRRMIVHAGHKICMIEDGDWDIALFTGGPDICPMLYGERMHETTYINIPRDLREIQFYRSLHHRRMKVGICRGAQFLNVMSGGRLWQHVNGHTSKDGHFIKIYDSASLVRVSSRHHQMMIPGSSAWIIGTAAEATRKINESCGEQEITPAQLVKAGYTDPEIVYYEDTHSLCFQPHPEDSDDDCRKLFFELIYSLWDDDFHTEALTEW